MGMSLHDKHSCHRIMIVDDEVMVTSYLQALLQTTGYKVVSFNDPIAAFHYFESSPDDVDLLITDQTMPGMSGMEMSEKFLALRSDFPIVLCTGYSETASEDSVKSLGISAFMFKPYKSSELLDAVENLISK